MENNNELIQFLILRNESLAEELGFEKGKQRVINIAVQLLTEQMDNCKEEEEEGEEEGEEEVFSIENFAEWLRNKSEKFAEAQKKLWEK